MSFPFFNGWNNWTTEEVESAVNISAEVRERHQRRCLPFHAACARLSLQRCPVLTHALSCPFRSPQLSAELWDAWDPSPSGPEFFNINVPVSRTHAPGAFAADAGGATGQRDATSNASASTATRSLAAVAVAPAAPPLSSGVAALRATGRALVAGTEVRVTVVDHTSYYGSLYGAFARDSLLLLTEKPIAYHLCNRLLPAPTELPLSAFCAYARSSNGGDGRRRPRPSCCRGGVGSCHFAVKRVQVAASEAAPV